MVIIVSGAKEALPGAAAAHPGAMEASQKPKKLSLELWRNHRAVKAHPGATEAHH